MAKLRGNELNVANAGGKSGKSNRNSLLDQYVVTNLVEKFE
jgi:hypothetical protein